MLQHTFAFQAKNTKNKAKQQHRLQPPQDFVPLQEGAQGNSHTPSHLNERSTSLRAVLSRLRWVCYRMCL